MSIEIRFEIVRKRSDGNEVRLLCCYCDHCSKTYDAFRKHLTREHSNEFGIVQVKQQASKLWKLHRESKPR